MIKEAKKYVCIVVNGFKSVKPLNPASKVLLVVVFGPIPFKFPPEVPRFAFEEGYIFS